MASRWRSLTPQFMAAARDHQVLRSALLDVAMHQTAALQLLGSIRREWSAPASIARSSRCAACAAKKHSSSPAGTTTPSSVTENVPGPSPRSRSALLSMESLPALLHEQRQRVQTLSSPRARSASPYRRPHQQQQREEEGGNEDLLRKLDGEELSAFDVAWERFPQARAGLAVLTAKDRGQQEAMEKRWAALRRIRSKVAEWISQPHPPRQQQQQSPGVVENGARLRASSSSSPSRHSPSSNNAFVDRFSEEYWHRIWRKSLREEARKVVRPRLIPA